MDLSSSIIFGSCRTYSQHRRRRASWRSLDGGFVPGLANPLSSASLVVSFLVTGFPFLLAGLEASFPVLRILFWRLSLPVLRILFGSGRFGLCDQETAPKLIGPQGLHFVETQNIGQSSL